MNAKKKCNQEYSVPIRQSLDCEVAVQVPKFDACEDVLREQTYHPRAPDKETPEHVQCTIHNESAVQEVMQSLQSRLPDPWTCVAFEEGFHVLLLSRGHVKAVQRQLSDENVNTFEEWVFATFMKVRSMEICIGVVDLDFKALWALDHHGHVDSNPYQETRYNITYRSNTCLMLISPRQWKCTHCSKVKGILKRRMCSRTQGVKLCTSNIYLTDHEKLQKLKNQKAELQAMRSKVKWLERKLFSCVDSHSGSKNSVKNILDQFVMDFAFSNITKGESSGS